MLLRRPLYLVSKSVVRKMATNAQAGQVMMRGVVAAKAATSDVGSRSESDTMGKIAVPNDVYWGAQTQRSLDNFKIGGMAARMPIEIIRG